VFDTISGLARSHAAKQKGYMIRIQDVNIKLGQFHLRDIELVIKEHEFFILMGPTGAGKTVLLEAIAGLIPVTSGTIALGGRNVTRLPPEKRNVGIVYQDFSLFPHLTVEENITFGVKYHPIDREKARSRFDRLVELLDLSHLLRRLPINLSGGENQRVALARSLMVAPQVLLLDEPLSALDPRFREEIRHGLKELHRNSNITFLMVTHDFAEALSLADRAAVMNDGQIWQTGTVNEIFEKPRSTFVADFVGMKNLFPSSFCDTRACIEGLEIELERQPANSKGYIAIRPEDIVLSRKQLVSSMRNVFTGIIKRITDMGLYYEVAVEINNITFTSIITKRSLFELNLREGLTVNLAFKTTAVHDF